MKVLVIDDQPEALKQIEKALKNAEGPNGRAFDVVALANHWEAIARLEKGPAEGEEHFDAVVTDMVMGRDETEGLEILRALSGKSPVTIILTAFPSIPLCVQSMRAGAWDYLEKAPQDGSDPYDNLIASLKEAYETRLENPELGRSRKDSQWVQEHLPELLKDHGGRLVAVLDQQVVDSDENYGILAERLKQRFPMAQPVIVSVPSPEQERGL